MSVSKTSITHFGGDLHVQQQSNRKQLIKGVHACSEKHFEYRINCGAKFMSMEGKIANYIHSCLKILYCVFTVSHPIP